MDPVTLALRDPTLTETLDEDMAATGSLLVGSLHGHAPDFTGGRRPDVLTIDLDLPPVDAAPKPKGPRWRLGELRASVRRLEAMVPNERERVRRRAQQWLGEL